MTSGHCISRCNNRINSASSELRRKSMGRAMGASARWRNSRAMARRGSLPTEWRRARNPRAGICSNMRHGRFDRPEIGKACGHGQCRYKHCAIVAGRGNSPAAMVRCTALARRLADTADCHHTHVRRRVTRGVFAGCESIHEHTADTAAFAERQCRRRSRPDCRRRDGRRDNRARARTARA